MMTESQTMTFQTAVAGELHCDVLVAGAGPAGLMAAISAAREGAKVILAERHGFVGGMLTAGEVRNVRVFNNGAGRMVIGGAPIEYLNLLKERGGCFNDPETYENFQQNPEITKHIGEQLCLKYGVKICYHTWVCGAMTEENTVKGVYILGKEGVRLVHSKIVIDATGDADVAAFAGAAFEKSEDLQPMTTTFMLGGVESDNWPLALSEESMKKFKSLVKKGLYPVPRDDLAAFKTARKGEVYCNITRYPGDCTSTEDLTRAEIECRDQMVKCVEFLRRELPEFKNCFLMHSAPQVGVRESRRIKGLYTLTEHDVWEGRMFDDAVALNAYFVDIHHRDEKTTHYPRKHGVFNGIPLRCFIPESVDGLLVCGRPISATHMGHGAIRVMGTAMGTGEAMGVTAAVSIEQGVQPRNVDVKKVQERLKKAGVPL